MPLFDFYKEKRVLVTGHTGFKGSWLCLMLHTFGAKTLGYALEPPNVPNLFSLCELDRSMKSVTGDIRDRDRLQELFNAFSPEIVIHMAAQPIVRASYKKPAYTYEVNVMGTVNVLECVRNTRSVRSVLNVTTDKVYKNREWEWGYRETDPLDGYDPYSNSKSCSELVTHSYKNSFFTDGRVAVSTARAGNVIGGGDFAADRIIPDCVRAALSGEKMMIRNPHSMRPYQHVLEPLSAYLLIAQRQYEDAKYADWYNVGPGESSCVSTGELVELFGKAWGNGFEAVIHRDVGPHEASFLRLDCSRIKSRLGWKPVWNIAKAIEKTVEWTKEYVNGGDVAEIMRKQIKEYKTATHNIGVELK